MRFLAFGWSTATLPPTAASTMASRDVGTCTRGRPRAKVAATKPARSQTMPPPSATMASPRSARWATSQS